jgi:hypothetical protein
LNSNYLILSLCIDPLSIPGEKAANNVSLVVSAPSFLHVVPKNVIIQRVGGMQATPVMVKLYFYATKGFLPTGKLVRHPDRQASESCISNVTKKNMG